MKQRLCLAKTLVHDPKVLLLDEPASGLDPRARIEIKELLKELKSMGKTIIISSHILPELADFCNKIGIIEQGEMIVSGDVGEIMRQVTGGKVLELKVLDRAERAVACLSELRDVKSARHLDGEGGHGQQIRVEYTGVPTETYRLIDTLHGEGIKVLALAEQQTDLEDIFLKVTRGVVS
jgi:ABC-2 type transport system ATP-binding protein